MEPTASGNPKDQYRMLLVAAALLVLVYILWTVRGALFPFAVGAVIAYLFVPIVRAIDDALPIPDRFADFRKTLAVILVYLGGLVGMTLLIVNFGPALVDQVGRLYDSIPVYWDALQTEFNYWFELYEEEVPEETKVEIENLLSEGSATLTSMVQSIFTETLGTLRRVIGFLTGFLLLPLWLFYVLKDERKALDWFYGIWPAHLQGDVREVVRIADRVLGSYVRGQLILGIVVGLASGIAFWLADIEQAVALGIVAGLLEVVPILGPWLTFGIAAIVALATEPEKIVWVAAICLTVQQVENTFLVPRIQGRAVDMNPGVIMVLLVIGGSMWGIVGVIAIVPAAAVVRDVFRYIYQRLSEDDMDDASPHHVDSDAV
ncbi:MAG: AI-2E family transporter [Chloroflexota bacterium]